MPTDSWNDFEETHELLKKWNALPRFGQLQRELVARSATAARPEIVSSIFDVLLRRDEAVELSKVDDDDLPDTHLVVGLAVYDPGFEEPSRGAKIFENLCEGKQSMWSSPITAVQSVPSLWQRHTE